MLFYRRRFPVHQYSPWGFFIIYWPSIGSDTAGPLSQATLGTAFVCGNAFAMNPQRQNC